MTGSLGARRLVLLVPTLLGVVTLVFAFLHLVPGDPVEIMLGESAAPADVAALRRDLGLDRPLPAQYARFLLRAARGDLGQSIAFRTSPRSSSRARRSSSRSAWHCPSAWPRRSDPDQPSTASRAWRASPAPACPASGSARS